ncbi:hypothetical protein [Streptomyces sp. 351MFTsu5.1]|uniref:hypothetical protein n=1 Tax=Streptomyces sp. 351MFTsu5.1 TaxID=1172180 RepID=UPI0003766E42|nr:hypothetical protein [Streptomyces sp. 351MFTsu5.1]
MTRRNHINHFTVAAACRANPGVWQPVGEYNSSQSAEGAVDYISSAYVKTSTQRSAYTPAGSFEARYELTEFGARVEARFVGTGNDLAWADALAGLPKAVAR